MRGVAVLNKKPNVLLFVPDGMQARVVDPRHECHTPHFTRLCAMGTRFTQAYTPSPTCSPARASLMTGLLPHNHGVIHVEHTVDDDQSVIRPDKPHWAQRLQAAGYRTGYFGKWHIERSHRLPDFGWEHSDLKPRDQLHPLHIDKSAAGRGKLLIAHHAKGPRGYGDRLHHGVTDQTLEQRGLSRPVDSALGFLDEAARGNDPWCCMVSFTQPNEAMICGEAAFDHYNVDRIELPATLRDELAGRPNIYKRSRRVWADMTDELWRQALACYYASITELDDLFGRLLHKLELTGQLDNTIIIITSDHGKYVGEHGMDSHNFGAFEPIYNIPLVIAGPGVAASQVSEARVGLHDLCPTILSLTGCEPISSPDSRSFDAALRDPAAAGYAAGYAESEGTRFVLTQRIAWDGDWKFVFNGFDEDELYNLANDPHEMTNLANDPTHRSRVEAMMELIWRRAHATGDRKIFDTDYFPMRIAAVGPHVAEGT